MGTEDCSESPRATRGEDLPTVQQPLYEIRVKGHLGDPWVDWFEGLTLSQEEGGITVLTGPLTDQAALHGLLQRIRNLCLPLISVNRVAMASSGSRQVAEREQRCESGRQ